MQVRIIIHLYRHKYLHTNVPNYVSRILISKNTCQQRFTIHIAWVTRTLQSDSQQFISLDSTRGQVYAQVSSTAWVYSNTGQLLSTRAISKLFPKTNPLYCKLMQVNLPSQTWLWMSAQSWPVDCWETPEWCQQRLLGSAQFHYE